MATKEMDFPVDCKFKHPLELLDELEEVRQKAGDYPAKYPADYVARLCTAIVAEHFGYEDRSSWTKRLKSDPDSHYYKRYHGLEGVFHS